ncbi:MAG: CpsD/CapB family tyrosine-protein kinase [Acidobacteria bacterium]|nr:CpsD/CapB family tyrosine-protein kinase [Acidobacteriota bacterium]
MSRVHDALRRAEGTFGMAAPMAGPPIGVAGVMGPAPETGMHGLLEQVKEVPWDPAAEAHLVDSTRPHDGPMEEFRSLRTRLNHLQGLQPLHTLVVTSASPAEGKSFTAANLAVVQSHLQGQNVLLCDFDFRRPIVHNLFKVDRSPGLTDYLQGKASLSEVIKRVSGTSLYIAPAGSAVINPLELLNLKEVRTLVERLPSLFNWVLLDSPPLLFAADANLLSTYCDGTLLVVRLGQTTIDAVTRALGGMSHNNVIGVVANAAKRGELYSKYTYYHNYYYYSSDDKPNDDGERPMEAAAPPPEAVQQENEEKDQR